MKTQEQLEGELHREINQRLLRLLGLQSIPFDLLDSEDGLDEFVEDFLHTTIEFHELVDFVKTYTADL